MNTVTYWNPVADWDCRRRHREASRMAQPVVSSPPATEPVTVEEARRHCRIDSNAEDLTLAGWVAMSREGVEIDAESALITQTRIQYLDYFPDVPIELRTPPFISLTSITYADADGTTQTLSASLYRADLTSKPGLIEPSYGNTWPVCRPQYHSIAVTFVCGYGAASAVPASAKQAMYLQIGSAYLNREMNKQETMAYDTLIDRLRWSGRV